MSDKFLNGTGLNELRNWVNDKLTTKQDTLISGTNIKTINGNSVLGSGDLTISGGLQNLVDGGLPGSVRGVGTLPTTRDYSTSLGYSTYVNNYYQLVIGSWNTNEFASNNLFVIGNGTSSSQRSNALTVDESGNVNIASGASYKINGVALSASDVGAQPTLVSGTNIKTVNNNSLLGSGNISVQAPLSFDTEPTASSTNPVTSDGIKAYIDNSIPAQATETVTGTIKLNPSESITLNSDGQLDVGGRLGQFPNGGVFYPTDITPSGVGTSSFLMTDGAKDIKVVGRTFAIMAGMNITCKSTAAGSTQYRVSNTYANRFLCCTIKGGRIAIDQNDAINNGTAYVESVKFADGTDCYVHFGAAESNNDIIITASRSVNPSAATTKLRGYGTNLSNDNILVGQGVAATNDKAISLGQATMAGGNQTVALGNSVHVLANNSVGMGHTLLVNKQYCFAVGQGHDFTNGANGTAAVGVWSEIDANTRFAVGIGTSTARKNAFEVDQSGSARLALDTSATSGTDKEIYDALVSLGWDSEVIV